ncbi:MAG: right-handed parallel beta-helix repeat-containing protein [Candidatus Thermoplasmatota archaeon]
MKRYSLPLVLLVFLLVSLMPVVVPEPTLSIEDISLLPKNTIYVDDNNTQGPWNGSANYPYQHISNGIQHAMHGDLIYVFSGFYSENLFINKSISLLGQQQDTTIIDGQNSGSVITIACENVHLQGFTIRNSGGYQTDAGVTINANTTTISECSIYRTRAGISVHESGGTIIASCRLHTNGFGISCSSSIFITIDQCLFYHNGAGVYLSGTSYVTITHSYADTNGIGFLCERCSHINISKSAARDNDDNEGGIFFVDCQNITIDNSYLVHNGVGVNLVNSSACFIQSCIFSLNTHFSCKIKESSSSILLTDCIFTKNQRYGLHAENSACTISWSNLFANENYGLYEKASVIDARYNWWGARSGPAYNGLFRADRGTWNPREVTYRPWLTFPMPEIGPDWDLEETFKKPTYTDPWSAQILFTDLDTDSDGAPDWWEIKWGYNPSIFDDHRHLDPDNDSLSNIEECYMDAYGSDPFYRDAFLEFDWTQSLQEGATNKPDIEDISQMIDAFARQDITLHIDTGELGGGEELPAQSFVSYAEIINLYWEYFLHNDLNNPRQQIFHYGIICDYSPSAGFAIMGWNHLNAFIIGAQILEENHPSSTRSWLAIAASMHEMGHTFGLIVAKYNGIDNHNTLKPYYKEFWMFLSYRSILNYMYTYSFMNFSDGSHGRGDFNDWRNLDFSFFKNTDFSNPV